MRFKSKLTVLLALLASSLCGCSGDTEEVKDNLEIFLSGRADEELNKTLDEAYNQDNIYNPILYVDVEKYQFDWGQAKGLAFPSANTPAKDDTNFRIASVTKMFTAVRIMQLIEEGFFDLDSTLPDILFDSDMPDGFSTDDLCRLLTDSCTSEITIKHLLNHTSGLRDFQFDFAESNPQHFPLAIMTAYDAAGLGFDGFSKIQWTPETLLSFYLASGLNAETANSPGAAYYYSDTNYLLLGIVIEKVTGLSLAENYNAYIYQPAGIVNAYLEWYEAPKSAPTMHQYQDGSQLGVDDIDVVAAEVNTSADWAGGGIVSNAHEIDRFFNTLFSGDFFENDATLDEMLKVSQANRIPLENQKYEASYGLGIEKRTYQLRGSKKVTLYGHTGFYGTFAFFHPETKTSIVFALNQGLLEEDWILKVLEDLNHAKAFGL